MKRFFETLKNIWTIEDLRVRIINTLGLLLIYRLGSYVVLPGVDSAALEVANAGNTGGIAGLLDLFAGGAFSRASIFALGIMPYISASIVVQLLGIAIPYFQKLQKEGESGRRKINQITRMLTIVIVAFQAPGYIASQVPELTGAGAIVRPDDLFWWISTVIILITGTMFVMWLGERITEKGLGNGISLIIMIGIIANLPFAFVAEFASRIEGGGLVILLLELVILLLVIIATILLVQGTRRVPVQFAKRVVGNKQYGGVRQYIPLKVNAAGVMPIIFAQAIMFIPITLAGFADSDSLTGITAALSDYTGFWYNLIFAIMIIAFTYFYTAVTVNPNQMAEDMKKNGGFIPGVKPGKRTADFLDNVLSRITLPGSIFLAIVAILPAFAAQFGVNGQFAQFYGGTSLLIMVGVILDTLQQIESHLLMRHYDGLMKTGKIKGRSSINMAG
ncbi:MAG: preprotein translocase subunit SecY [Flavobacteriales bacterium]|nr:preprotein translocase subunit SecY [Flavobacteriales bacterium]|tara:strand:- start:35163 stop:36503 length:1341 start_codon:yes stop_codon:yes gene_type:complete